ncbi:endothelin-converting enzyme homolog isoform X2 [Neocloeon triangulifer]|uniref:endothelin-converting enzyme homolog isoform X2 n=1 Tax=Neocloeon triangulifer TaxID=2078957 RepID=UPI00286F200F|nr:endothelin-converting enzyme homolog isoform X2 [Neocloeon triangulifer]
MAEAAAEAAAAPGEPHAEAEQQQQQQQGSRGARLRRLCWLLGVLLVGLLLVVSPRFLQDLDLRAGFSRDEVRDAGDCRKEDDCSGRNNSSRVCKRDQCLMAASRLRTMLNAAADPCEDFYEFACGRWSEQNAKIAPSFNTLQKHVNLEIQMLLSRESKLKREPFRKLGEFYGSCVAAKGSSGGDDKMFGLLEELGGFASRGESSRANLTRLIARLLRVNGAPLFDVYVDEDVNRRSRLAIYIDLPQKANVFLKLLRHDPVVQWWQKIVAAGDTPRRATRNEHARSNKAFNYMKATAEEKKLVQAERLAQHLVPATVADATRASEVQQILLFVSMLTKSLPGEKEMLGRMQTRQSLPPIAIADLQRRFDAIDWKLLMLDVFALNVSDHDFAYVLAPHYMRRLFSLINRFDKSVLHNSLLVLFARDSLLELVNTSAVGSWDGYCTRITTNVFTGAVSALYVRQYSQHFLLELQTRVQELFDQLKHALGGRIASSLWLDEESRAAAAAKLRTLSGHFFTWPHFWNESYVASAMSEIDVREDDFFWNVVRRYQQLRAFNGTLDEADSYEKKWAYPFVVNAFYEQRINSIVIPLAVLTEPYFQQDMPRYIPYGKMGLIFTHEILHAFDLLGVQFDERGEKRPWLSEQAKAAFEERLECVADQYKSTFIKKVPFMGSQIDVEFDWNITINENMADISGLHIAYEAWRREQLHLGFSDPTLPNVDLKKEQLFFVSAAQTYCSNLSAEDYILLVELDFHTPFPERVNGIMMNSAEFASAFQCPLGSPMNPERKCFLW